MKIIKFIAVILLSINVFADDAQDFAARMGEQKSLSGDFQQTVKDAKGEVLQESSGKFALLRPGYFRWETIEPFPQLLMSDLKTIWLHDPDLEQVTVREYDDRVSQTPAVLFSGDPVAISTHYSIKKINNERYQLTPKVPQELFEHLWVEFVDSKLVSMTLQDSLAQETVFALNNTKLNAILNLEQFQFIPPEGTDIILGN